MRPARLIPLLVGFALLVPLTWFLVRAGRETARAVPVDAPASRRSRPAAEAAPGEAGAPRERRGAGDDEPARPLRELSIPVAGIGPRALQGTFSQSRGGTRSHEALDIAAPRGTPVVAAGDGVVRKLFTSVRGGLTVYEFDPEELYCYYYAHLDGYAPGLYEGQVLRRGDLVGYVGSTGNAREDAPHLHFAVTRLDPDGKWWGGTPIDPYPLLVRAP